MDLFNQSPPDMRIVVGAGLCVLVLILTTRTRQLKKGLRLPPGPRGYPILGNITDMPNLHEWQTFTQWGKEYGEMVYIKVLRQPMVIVNSVEIAHDLFEKKSWLYSDRIDLPMLNDLMGFDWNMGFMHYGKRWNRHRKMFHKYTQAGAAARWHDIQMHQARSILQQFLHSPEDFMKHLHHMAGATIMELVYGIKVLPKGDRYIDLAQRAVSAMAVAATPGAFLVDFLPIMKYIPEWVPGAGFQKQARIWRRPITEMAVAPYVAVKRALNTGTARPSLITALLEDLSNMTNAPEDEEEIIRNTGAVAYLAGADSTCTALVWFMLAMVLHPDAQQKAQAELDSVLGPDRLPTFEDRANLMYVSALCKEVLRWHPGAPLGIGHRVTQDDVYGEYFIPKGTIIVGNTWGILHDEKNYGQDPESFRPERFLRPGISDPTAAFGFGRRICPGRFIAENSIFISVASILKVFNITRARDGNGEEIPVEVLCTSGAISSPLPFKCAILPRNATAESLLLQHVDN